MIMHRLERILGPAEHASKPGHDLLPPEPVRPYRILGTADVLDHGEIAQAPPEPPPLSIMTSDVYRSTAEARVGEGGPGSDRIAGNPAVHSV